MAANTAIEEIKRRLDIVDLISAAVPLKRSGKGFKGLCPFHGEKTPSFYVWPDRGFFHCFGCGASGDHFTFLMRRDNLEFPEALRALANQAGVEVEPAARPDPLVRERESRLHALLESAALYYRGLLRSRPGAGALDYLHRRGLVDETIDRFALGYAEPSGDGVVRQLESAGYTVAEMLETGLLGESDDGRPYPYFRNRAIFPIRDAEGRTVGFGGRALADAQQPKYLNSPQTNLFDKGANLYALDLARGAIRDARQAVVVEGYMDTIVAHQHGFVNVVATLGTAIGERHIDILRRLAPEIILALDDDAAGVRAAVRGSEVAFQATADESPAVLRVRGLGRFFADRRTQVKIMQLTGGRDPDDLIRADPELWRRLATQAVPAIEFLLVGLAERHDLDTTEGRRNAAREAMAVIQELPDPIERSHHIQRLARILRTREEFLLQLAETRPRPQAPRPTRPDPPAAPYIDRLEEHVLALILALGERAERPDADDFDNPLHRAIAEQLARMPAWPDVATCTHRLATALGDDLADVMTRLAAAADEHDVEQSTDAERDLLVRTLELRKLRLFRQHQALESVLRDEIGELEADERRQHHQRLGELAQRLGQLFVEQSRLGVVGSTSWGTRRAREMVGG
jgi:DNA primase